jgi:AcrR family transcriptional regulator
VAATENTESPSPARSVDGYKHGRVPRAVRRNQLLELAEELFMEKGYGGFSIDDLCRAAGVSRPIVYDHFGSKDGLYITCLRRIREEFEQAILAAAASAKDLHTTIRRSSEVWFSMIEREPQRWSLVYGGATGLVGPIADQLADLRESTVRQLAMVFAAYAPHADAEEVSAFAHAASGSGEQLGRWWLRNSEIPRERIVELHSEFVTVIADHLISVSEAAAAPA